MRALRTPRVAAAGPASPRPRSHGLAVRDARQRPVPAAQGRPGLRGAPRRRVGGRGSDGRAPGRRAANAPASTATPTASPGPARFLFLAAPASGGRTAIRRGRATTAGHRRAALPSRPSRGRRAVPADHAPVVHRGPLAHLDGPVPRYAHRSPRSAGPTSAQTPTPPAGLQHPALLPMGRGVGALAKSPLSPDSGRGPSAVAEQFTDVRLWTAATSTARPGPLLGPGTDGRKSITPPVTAPQ